MAENGRKSPAENTGLGWKRTLLISILILLAGAGLTAYIFLTEPAAVREGATRETAMLVKVTGVEKGDFQPSIVATGVIQPALDIILRPRVKGEIIDQAPNFSPGGRVAKGEILLRLDPADFENVLQQRKSDLRRAEAELNIEMGRQEVARQDYQLLAETLSESNRALILRQPQLETALARVEAARAAVNQAELDLQRTIIRAPFNAQVLSRSVNIGSQVDPGDELGRLVGTEVYWVEMSVPRSKLKWLTFPDDVSDRGSEVLIRDHSAWSGEQNRTGQLFQLVGALEDTTRMARVLATVEDPLARRPGSADLPVLIIGTFVEVVISGKTINNVFRLNQDFIRKNNTVWVMQDGKLDIRPVEILMSDAEYAYITGGLQENDRIVITNLATVAEGAALRLEDSTSPARQQSSAEMQSRQNTGVAR